MINVRSVSSREMIRIVIKQGWKLARVNGDDHIFKHQNHSKIITIPHPKKTLNPKTIMSILKSSKINKSSL